jgi:hypothetical protein
VTSREEYCTERCQWLATATPEELAREMKRCLLKAIRAFEDATIALTKLRGW